MNKVQANEITYELHSLGWKAFQNLCVTVMGEIWGQVVQGFFDSHDGGRDGAFHGIWTPTAGESFQGSFTAQCKFTAKVDKCLQVSDLTDELKKAKRLASKGLADNYILFTNFRLTGSTDEKIIKKVFEDIPGVKRFAAYGCERLSQIIQESPRLRMLVPRVYGLGDLSQILDERAYDQAQEILSSLGDDLGKFIITDAYRQSAKALVEHGFVLLLGEPMCGKSTIAAALAMGALDEWGCSTIKVRDADDFVKHSNPHEKQLFWVDDAFGATQFDWDCAVSWNQTFPHMNAAIHRGAKVIFTSRDYIYKSAKRCLKESALPVMKESQVVIQVEKLTKEEREQILYNHIKLGRHSMSYKAELKPLLPDVVLHEKFSPEIARRLGNPLFTKELTLSKYGLSDFVEKPLELLCEIINTMDDGSRSALALVFMRGGSLPCPLALTNDEEKAISRLGGSVGNALKGLESLNESLLVNSIEEGNYSWRFKHPTVRDAFAKIVASSQDLMDIYLTGAPLDKLFSEISCGDVGVRGSSVVVPNCQYKIVIDKIRLLDITKWFNKSALCRFLSYRCDKDFLELFIEEFPQFISQLSVSAYIYANSDVDVLVRLHKFNLLSEKERAKAVISINYLSTEVPDAGFLQESIKGLMTDQELSNILINVQQSLLPDLDSMINNWRDNFDGEEDPEAYFEELKCALDDYKEIFEGNEVSCKQIDDAIEKINQVVEALRCEYPENHFDDDSYSKSSKKVSAVNEIRSIFDDVDI